MSLIIKGAQLVDHCGVAPLDIYIENGTVLATGYDIDPSPEDDVVDARGLVVLPGMVDIHTHLSLEVGKYTSSDDFNTGSAGAIAGGTTTVVDYITPVRGENVKEAIDRWFKKAAESRVDYSFHLTLTDASDETFRGIETAAEMGIRGFKVFMAYPDRLMISDDDIMRIMKKVKSVGGVLFVHTEDGVEIEKLRNEAEQAGNTGMKWHAASRPSYQEHNAAKRLYEMVKNTFCPTVIVHISAGEVVDVLREASLSGVPLFGETCPHYLWLNESMLERPWPESATYVCSPPLRTSEHMSTLWDALIFGDIDLVSTDHCPFSFENRTENGENFTKVPNGLSGIESRFMLMQNGAISSGRFGWTRLVRLLSTNPAIIAGLYPKKGTIRPGSDADLVFFDPSSVTNLESDNMFTSPDANPYDGMSLLGAVAAVISRGEVVYDNGILTAEPGRGEFVPRKRIDMSRLWTVKMEDHPWAFCQ
ncbi:MAG: dihydropyrimidinase [Deltaproteobacteria bacterium]|nr:dihydropyrimidinase [Deltaproteobacteria bacterium]